MSIDVGVVRGIAQLDGRLYVVCELSCVIHVYDTTNNQRLSDINVPGMDDPNDIAACTTTRHLYIADLRTHSEDSVGCLWKVSPSGTAIRWALKDNTRPYALSVNNGCVLVTPLAGEELVIYSSENEVTKRVPLPKRMEPRHAVETERNTIIVCHWTRSRGQNTYHIAEFDYDGEKVNVFCSREKVNDFPYLCLDSDGRMLVVDAWNNRVIVLNKYFQLERVLVHHLDTNPYRLCFSEQTGQLFIGESSENVKVYSVSYPQTSARKHSALKETRSFPAAVRTRRAKKRVV